jgi:GNAT superfamily N-acetyltransferase
MIPRRIEEIAIREVGRSDLEEILIHRRQMFRDMGYRDEVALDRLVSTSRDFLTRCLRDGSYRGWFAIAADSLVVAGVGLLVTPWVAGPEAPEQSQRAYLLNVYTVPAFRGRGLARHLTEKAIEWCRQQGLTMVWLHASEFGRPLYESLGFQATNEMKLRIR